MAVQISKLEVIAVGDGWVVGRVLCPEQVRPYLKEIVTLTNSVLPQAYPRVSIEELAKTRHQLPDGRWVDFEETWRGHSFLVFQHNNLVGVSLGRREIVLNENGERCFTGRGFVPCIVAAPQLQRSPKKALLALPLKSLIEAGAIEIRGSCSTTNTMVERMCSRFADKRWEEGEWIRYSIAPSGVERLFKIVVKSQNLQDDVIKLLVGPPSG